LLASMVSIGLKLERIGVVDILALFSELLDV
jgi:hypothetical protein